tara:strand:+ start:301 stop:480 length:180 start_codon:yes stop_codon:yes gene_type:complete
MDIVNQLFQFCVNVMYALAHLTGFTYKEINAIVFLIIQPMMVILFFLLWRYEKIKNRYG